MGIATACFCLFSTKTVFLIQFTYIFFLKMIKILVGLIENWLFFFFSLRRLGGQLSALNFDI